MAGVRVTALSWRRYHRERLSWRHHDVRPVLTGYALASLFMSRATTKFSSVVRVAVVLALLLSGVYVFPRAVTATETRFADAARSESFSGRIASIFLGEQLDVYDGAPLIGYGIGEGSNFAGVQATGRRAFLLAETEIARTDPGGRLSGLRLRARKGDCERCGCLGGCSSFPEDGECSRSCCGSRPQSLCCPGHFSDS